MIPDSKLQVLVTYVVVYVATQQMIYRIYRERGGENREALVLSLVGATMPFAAWGMLLLFTITAPLRRMMRA